MYRVVLRDEGWILTVQNNGTDSVQSVSTLHHVTLRGTNEYSLQFIIAVPYCSKLLLNLLA
jgi:hypothetical protein